MLLLAKMGDDRIIPKAATILKDSAFTPQDRSTAARALSLIKEPAAVDPLLELADDEKLPAFLQQGILSAIGQKKDRRAIPVLDRIIAAAPTLPPANYPVWGSWRRGYEAKKAKDTILFQAPGRR